MPRRRHRRFTVGLIFTDFRKTEIHLPLDSAAATVQHYRERLRGRYLPPQTHAYFTFLLFRIQYRHTFVILYA